MWELQNGVKTLRQIMGLKVFKDMDHRRLQKADDEEEGDSDREFCLSSSRNWATSNLWQASDPLGMSRL
ncbi:hypothetical protein Bca4012_074674 [Brassica carinata]